MIPSSQRFLDFRFLPNSPDHEDNSSEWTRDLQDYHCLIALSLMRERGDVEEDAAPQPKQVPNVPEKLQADLVIAGSIRGRISGQLKIGLDIRVKLQTSLSPTDNLTTPSERNIGQSFSKIKRAASPRTKPTKSSTFAFAPKHRPKNELV